MKIIEGTNHKENSKSHRKRFDISSVHTKEHTAVKWYFLLFQAAASLSTLFFCCFPPVILFDVITLCFSKSEQKQWQKHLMQTISRSAWQRSKTHKTVSKRCPLGVYRIDHLIRKWSIVGWPCLNKVNNQCQSIEWRISIVAMNEKFEICIFCPFFVFF